MTHPIAARGACGLILLGLMFGCAGDGARKEPQGSRIPPTPTAPEKEEGGIILKTGSLQLGPGTTKNSLWLQGDGEGGFFVTDP